MGWKQAAAHRGAGICTPRRGHPAPIYPASPTPQGCEGIDEHLLLGGLRRGHLHELCGESGEAGKGGWRAPRACLLRVCCAVCLSVHPRFPPACPPAATGKTQLCLAAAARTARDAMRVVYVDTSNAFSSRRLQRVLAALPPSDVPQVWPAGRACPPA